MNRAYCFLKEQKQEQILVQKLEAEPKKQREL